jgi:HK97 family phage portal protein
MKIPFFSKTIKSEAAPLEQKSYSLLMPEYGILRGISGNIYAYRNLTPDEIISQFERIHPIYTGVMRIANAVASLPVQLIDRKTKESRSDHAAFQLLENPNTESEKTRFEYLQSALVNYILTGNTFLTLTGSPSRPPLELYLLNPLVTRIQTESSSGRISELHYTSHGSSSNIIFKKKPDGFFYSATNLQQVYSIYNYNPRFGCGTPGGRSELGSLYAEINLYAVAMQHNSSLLENGARPTGMFILKTQSGAPAQLSDVSYARMKEEINSNYMGAQNAGRPLLLEGGLEWQSLEMSPRDLDFNTMIERAEDSIYNLLGVPSQLIKPVKTTANNLVNVRKEFYENRILPLGDLFCSHLTNALLPRYQEGKKTAKDKYVFQINRDEIDVLSAERIAFRKSYESSLIHTVNEKRKIFNLPEVPGGDKIVDPNGRPIAGDDAVTVIGENGTVALPNPDLAPSASKSNNPINISKDIDCSIGSGSLPHNDSSFDLSPTSGSVGQSLPLEDE